MGNEQSTLKPIILISGTSGIGKSTIAKELFNKLNIDHRQTTGMIREIIAAESTKETDPYLYHLTYDAEDPLTQFLSQARRIEKAVKACIHRCRREDSSLIIEGNHLIPELFHNAPIDLLIVITNSDQQLHKQRILQNDVHRFIDEKKFENIRIIDTYLVNEAKKYGILVVENQDSNEVIEKIIHLIENPKNA